MGPGASEGAKSHAHRSAIAQLVAIWGALPRSFRRFASDFAAVAVQEGSEVPGRLARTTVSFAIAGIFIVTVWLLLCLAAVAWTVSAYGWEWQSALGLVALLNLLFAAIAAVAGYHWLKAPFFPITSYELHRLREFDSSAPPAGADAIRNRRPSFDVGPKEEALLQSEAELEAQISLAKRATPHLLTRPQVIASTAAVGLVLGLITSSGKRRVYASDTAKRSMTTQLLTVALGQLSSLAVAAAMREFERRREQHHGRFRA